MWTPVSQQPGIITFTGLWIRDIMQGNLQFVADALSSAEIELPAAEEESLAAWNWNWNGRVILVKKHEVCPQCRTEQREYNEDNQDCVKSFPASSRSRYRWRGWTRRRWSNWWSGINRYLYRTCRPHGGRPRGPLPHVHRIPRPYGGRPRSAGCGYGVRLPQNRCSRVRQRGALGR